MSELNYGQAGGVGMSIRAAVSGVTMAAALGLLAGCISVEGGAIEASWDLRFADGRRVDDSGKLVDCEATGLAWMQFSVTATSAGEPPCGSPGECPCQGADHCRFACAPFGSGTTDFAIPEGDYAISFQVVDDNGEILGPGEGIVTPGPVVRQVRVGEITDLNVNLIIVDRN